MNNVAPLEVVEGVCNAAADMHKLLDLKVSFRHRAKDREQVASCHVLCGPGPIGRESY
jgi:hypothetical protein